jgi:hypothetical protein
MEVKKYLFDYGDLTDFEKTWLKQVFPFYTWTRKNIPLQAAMLIQKPTKISVVGKAKDNIERAMEGEKMDEKYIPEWMKESYPVWLGTDEDNINKFFNLKGFVPTIDLQAIADPTQTALDMLSPLIKTPVEMLANYDTFYRTPIKEDPAQTREFFGEEIDPYLHKMIKMIRPIADIERQFGDRISGALGTADVLEDPDSEEAKAFLKKSKEPITMKNIMEYMGGKTRDLDPEKKKRSFDWQVREVSEEMNKVMDKYDKEIYKSKYPGVDYDSYKNSKEYKDYKAIKALNEKISDNKKWKSFMEQDIAAGKKPKYPRDYEKIISDLEAKLLQKRIDSGVDMNKINILQKTIQDAESGEGIRIS